MFKVSIALFPCIIIVVLDTIFGVSGRLVIRNRSAYFLELLDAIILESLEDLDLQTHFLCKK